MSHRIEQTLEPLVRRYRSGFTLPGEFYLDPEIFDYEMEHVLGRNWWLARFSSELARPGDYAVVNVARSSIILIRGRDGTMRGFYNVCRHRGAVLCNDSAGNMARITCPYHAWSYGLDGSLLAAAYMRDDFDKSQYGLRPVNVAEQAGLIFFNLAQEPGPLDTLLANHHAYLEYQGLPKAKVVRRTRYVIEADWKIAIENLLECYHCCPSHPGLSQVEGRDELVAYGLDPASAAAATFFQRVAPRVQDLEEKLNTTDAPRAPFGRWFEDTGVSAAQRYPLAKGFDTGTLDGKLVFKPMQAADLSGVGTRLAMTFGAYIQAYPDHCVALSYFPQGPHQTLVDQAWLIAGDAVVDDVAQIEAITALWDGVTREDGALSENQVRGVRSPGYSPGPLGNMEPGTQGFLDWYIAALKRSLDR